MIRIYVEKKKRLCNWKNELKSPFKMQAPYEEIVFSTTFLRGLARYTTIDEKIGCVFWLTKTQIKLLLKNIYINKNLGWLMGGRLHQIYLGIFSCMVFILMNDKLTTRYWYEMTQFLCPYFMRKSKGFQPHKTSTDKSKQLLKKPTNSKI